jgi:CheY-like chemotaxis protein/light-regulated signal transduction histidine kinase (bacteriophytochrome)
MKIVIVDDIATNRKLLRVTLQAEGHTTLEAADGVEALQILAREKVDAVLSDILMPRMDGYRLCHEIRTNDRLRNLPIVIYTSTYTALSDEKLALNLGADKYLKKPAPVEIILTALHEAIAMQHSAPRHEAWQEVEVLKEYSDRLVTKLAKKNVDLTEANERLTILDRSKNEFLNLIAHEFRTPLNGLLGVGEVILEEISSTEENNELRGLFERSRRRILTILDDALLLTEIDVHGTQFKCAAVLLSAVLRRAVTLTTEFADSRHVVLIPPAEGLDLVLGDEVLLVRALHALLETAVKFSEKGKTVQLYSDVVCDSARVTIETQGRTIPDSALAKFFDLFSIGEATTPGGDLGLGPPVAYRILSLFGASVSVANRAPSGIRLAISLKKGALPEIDAGIALV